MSKPVALEIQWKDHRLCGMYVHVFKETIVMLSKSELLMNINFKISDVRLSLAMCIANVRIHRTSSFDCVIAFSLIVVSK